MGTLGPKYLIYGYLDPLVSFVCLPSPHIIQKRQSGAHILDSKLPVQWVGYSPVELDDLSQGVWGVLLPYCFS